MADSRFEWYEIVRVNSTDSAKVHINGELGAILGKAQGDSGQWSYAVHIYKDGMVWSFMEHELSSTGEFDTREAFYSGESTRVSPRGEILR